MFKHELFIGLFKLLITHTRNSYKKTKDRCLIYLSIFGRSVNKWDGNKLNLMIFEYLNLEI